MIAKVGMRVIRQPFALVRVARSDFVKGQSVALAIAARIRVVNGQLWEKPFADRVALILVRNVGQDQVRFSSRLRIRTLSATNGPATHSLGSGFEGVSIASKVFFLTKATTPTLAIRGHSKVLQGCAKPRSAHLTNHFHTYKRLILSLFRISSGEVGACGRPGG